MSCEVGAQNLPEAGASARVCELGHGRKPDRRGIKPGHERIIVIDEEKIPRLNLRMLHHDLITSYFWS